MNPLFAQQTYELPGDIVIGAPDWILPTLVVGVGCTLLVVWNYASSRRDRWSILGAVLKLAAIALLAVCMLQPMRRGQRPRPRANLLPIVIDDSRSMNLANPGKSETWHGQIKTLIGDPQRWPTQLGQTFDVRTYAFDSRLRELDSADDLVATGDDSRLSQSLSELSQRLAERPVAGVILMSDGNDTQKISEVNDWSSLGFPVYPILPAESPAIHDLRIVDTSVRQTNFETSPITLNATLAAVGMSQRVATIQLREDLTGRVVAEKTHVLGEDDENQTVSFQFRPDESGLQFYRVVAFSEADRDVVSGAISASGQVESGAGISSESTLLNNSKIVAVHRDSGPYRVLYLSGRANWEYKFLNRALASDAEVQLVGLLRIAKKEAKFSFRDRGVSDTNPLFQGVADDPDAAEQYDEPVIIRLGVKESEELSKGFPKTADELFAYHAIILDDIEPDFFTQDQMLLIRQFVSARGGGLLMLGGQESFDGKRFADTPLGALSPFYEATSPQHKPSEFGLSISREGLLQPWMRLRETEVAETERLREMPAFQSVNSVGSLKPGAMQLATVTTPESDTLPALAAQRFGKGRSAAMPIADFWRWSMRRSEKSADDPEQAWRQIVRWLVSEVPRRVQMECKDQQDTNGSVAISVNVLDDSFLGVDNATVSLTITPPSGEPLLLRADASGDAAGVYACDYWPRDPGAYRVNASVDAPDGSLIGRAESGWTKQKGGAEYDRLAINRELLNQIAQQSGGKVIDADSVESFISRLPSDKIPQTEYWVYPIWHRPWIMMLAIACLCTEWGLRRWRGLA
ncbi:glutamine amidotransferase [Stieleria varia]|nr:glutamine amidotransferase [Stieleria varia]